MLIFSLQKGRTSKEIAGLNQECDILRKLNHTNIIPMLDSFETENEVSNNHSTSHKLEEGNFIFPHNSKYADVSIHV